MRVSRTLVVAIIMFAIGSIFAYGVSHSDIRFTSSTGKQADFIAPYGDIDPSDIVVYDNKVEVTSENRRFIRGIVGPTNSMKPVFGTGATVIESEFTVDDWKNLVGRFVSFEYKGVKYLHQVVEVGIDTKGRFAKTKGTNNLVGDDLLVREPSMMDEPHLIGIVEMVVYSR